VGPDDVQVTHVEGRMGKGTVTFWGVGEILRKKKKQHGRHALRNESLKGTNSSRNAYVRDKQFGVKPL